MDKLTSERVIAIIEDTIEKLSFLESITPDILQHRDELSKFIGDEIAKTMDEQRRLERKYEELIEQRASMKGMLNKSKYKEIQEEIQDISRALRESTNNLVRSLKDNPNVSGNLIKVQRDRTEVYDLLLRCIQEVREKGTYKTIADRVDEENSAKIRFQELKKREKDLRQTVATLQERLSQTQKSFQFTSTEQRQAIMTLKDELQVLKSSTTTDSSFKRKESSAKVSAIWRSYQHKEKELLKQLKELQSKLSVEQLVNNETKEFLTNKHNQLVEEIIKWDNKYEKEVNDIDNDIKKLANSRMLLLEKLNELKIKKELEDKEINELKQKKILDIELAKQRIELLKRQNRAARCIQKQMKLYLKRKKELEAIKLELKKKKAAAKSKKAKKNK
eukprot:gene19762-25695_t